MRSFDVKNLLAFLSRPRKVTSWAVAVVVGLLTVVVVVQATRAEGRHSTRATFNDGGAWLLNGTKGVAGHVNLVVEEFSDYVALDGRSVPDMAVLQSPGLVALHDESAHELILIDESLFERREPIKLPEGSSVFADIGGIVVFDELRGCVYRLPLEEARGIGDGLREDECTDDGLIYNVEKADDLGGGSRRARRHGRGP